MLKIMAQAPMVKPMVPSLFLQAGHSIIKKFWRLTTDATIGITMTMGGIIHMSFLGDVSKERENKSDFFF